MNKSRSLSCLTAKPALITLRYGPCQGCQTRGLLGATLHVGNRAEGRMMFFDLEITTCPGNGLCNVARSKVDLKKKGHYLSGISTPSPLFRHR